MYHKENNDASLYSKAKMSGSYLQSSFSTSGGIFGLHTCILPHPSYTHLLCVFFLVLCVCVCICINKYLYVSFHEFLGGGEKEGFIICSKEGEHKASFRKQCLNSINSSKASKFFIEHRGL